MKYHRKAAMNKDETSNESRNFLQEHKGVIALQVFEHASTEYLIYLEKQIIKRNTLLEKQLDENTYHELKDLEEQIPIMLGFFAMAEATIKTLEEKAYKHLNFDSYEWERYKAIERKNEQWMQIFRAKYGEKKYDRC